MGSDIVGVILAALGGAVAALLLVALVALLRRRNRTRADLEAMLEAAQRESDDLRTRLEELTALLTIVAPERRLDESATYLITDAGVRPAEVAVPVADPIAVPDRLVLTATVGAPLVKVAALGHGLRRALSAESRNRIWFEMRKEVRSSRKRRRQLLKEYQRQVRADARERDYQEGLA